MKSYYLMLFATVCFSGAIGLIVYKYFDGEVEKAFEKGVARGKIIGQMNGVDTVTLDGTIFKSYAPKIKVDSIVFHYDSILVLHYNNSEVK